jgi:CheY-like chemotaxis protein
VLNLAINARDAMAEGGSVAISTSGVTLLDDENGLAPGAYITLEVTDDGAGMTPEIISRAFDPFFTTKPPGQGTGLGLAQVYGVARQCGGDARIRSEPGKGTAVTLWLRCAAEARTAAEHDDARPPASPKAGKVLLIDDDPDVRNTVRELLIEMGYDVQTANSGKAGIEMLDAAQPDLVIVDFAMPEMNGAEVAKIIHHSRPALPILFVSGHADTSALQDAVGNAPLLRKPFRPADLATAMEETLRLASAQD